jgi:hypothetical protein
MSLSYLCDDWYKQAVTHIRESRRFELMYTLHEKTRPTCHTPLMLNLHMVQDHTYLTWSTYSNLSHGRQQWLMEPLLLRKGLLTQSTARQLTNLWVCTQFLFWASHWSSGGKATHYWRQTTWFTGPINTSMWSERLILVRGANPSVLNQRRQGLQP